MSKMSKAIAILGVVAGLGVAALPLSSYAAPGDPNTYSQSTSAQVQVEVEGAISIASNVSSMDGGIVNLGSIMPGGVSEESEDLEITVSSNYTNANELFNLYIHSLEVEGTGDSAMAVLKGNSTGATITSSDATPAANVSTWAYKYAPDAETLAWGDYKVVPAKATKVNDGTKLSTTGAVAGTTKASNKSHFKFQASAATNQTADIYTGTVVFTAVVE